MHQRRIITAILARVSSASQVYTYLLTDQSYDAHGLGSQIVDGVAKVVLPKNSSLGIRERIYWQTQNGTSGIGIGSIPIINDGQFDSWARYNFAGMDWTVKRLYEDEPWSAREPLFAGKGDRRPELERNRIIVTIVPKLSKMREAIAQTVFDDSTENESLRNTIAPMLFGECYQIDPKAVAPSIRAKFVADNLAALLSVAEGGNPQTPQYVRLPQGLQLTAEPSLPVTADAAGPPAENPDESADELDGEGQFEDWDSSGELQYPNLTVETSANATLTEGANSATGVLEIQASTGFDTGFQSGTNETVSNQVITAGELGLSLPANAIVTGIEVEATARWQQVSGLTFADEIITSLGFVTPGGFTFGAQPSPNELNETFDDYSVGADGNLLGADASVLTADDVNSDDFKIRIASDVRSGQQLVVSSLQIKVYYVEERQYVRFTWSGKLTVGQQYTIAVETVGSESPEDSVYGDWSNSVNSQDPYSARGAAMAGSNTHEYVFTSGSTDLDLYFYKGNGNGDQEINSIVITKGSSALNRYHELMRYIIGTAGYVPDEVGDNDDFALVQAQADNPRLGHYVTDQTTREQLATYLSHSLAATCWAGLDGKYHATQMRTPQQPAGEYLTFTKLIGSSRSIPDTGEDLRDRVHAAPNQRPLTEAELAGVTSTWTRNQREQVMAKYRITERADFNNLIDYDGGALSVDSIDPTAGAEAGGTAVTIYGSGFAAGATVTIGGNAATSVGIVDSATITAVTPAGTVGSVDVVVTVDGESVTLTDGFEYEAAINYAAFDPALTGDSIVLSESNRLATYPSGGGGLNQSALSTGPKSSGKYYFEYEVVDGGSPCAMGISESAFPYASKWCGDTAGSYGHWRSGLWNNGSNQDSSKTFNTNDVVMVAFDADAGKLWFGRNGAWYDSGDPGAGTGEQFSGIPATVRACVSPYDPGRSIRFVGEADGLNYAAPSGFTAGWDL